MTAEDWETSSDPLAMLRALEGKVSDRKLRLLTCVRLRHYPVVSEDQSFQEAIGRLERWVDRGILDEDVRNTVENIFSPVRDFWSVREILTEFQTNAYIGALIAIVVTFSTISDSDVVASDEIRCLFGNPFPPAVPRLRRVLAATGRAFLGVIASSPLRAEPGEPVLRVPGVEVEAEWLTSAVLGLANGIYESRDFAATPLLADALQDAHCENEHVLIHLRGPGPHVKGCWVVDMLLGKE